MEGEEGKKGKYRAARKRGRPIRLPPVMACELRVMWLGDDLLVEGVTVAGRLRPVAGEGVRLVVEDQAPGLQLGDGGVPDPDLLRGPPVPRERDGPHPEVLRLASADRGARRRAHVERRNLLVGEGLLVGGWRPVSLPGLPQLVVLVELGEVEPAVRRDADHAPVPVGHLRRLAGGGGQELVPDAHAGVGEDELVERLRTGAEAHEGGPVAALLDDQALVVDLAALLVLQRVTAVHGQDHLDAGGEVHHLHHERLPELGLDDGHAVAARVDTLRDAADGDAGAEAFESRHLELGTHGMLLLSLVQLQALSAPSAPPVSDGWLSTHNGLHAQSHAG